MIERLKQFAKHYGWVLALVAIVRLLWLCVVLFMGNEESFFLFDSHTYEHIAHTYQHYGQMAYHDPESGIFYQIHNYTPLYPLFIAAVKSLGGGVIAIVVLQFLFCGISAIIVYKIGELFGFKPKALKITAVLIAIDIPSIVFSTLLMSESLFTLLFLAAVWYFLKGNGLHKAWKHWLVAGVFLGLAILCRPVGLYLPFLFLLFVIIQKKMRMHWLASCTFLVGVLLVLSPWLVRNYTAYGTPFVSTMGSTNLYLFRAAGTMAVVNGTSLLAEQEALKGIEAMYPDLKNTNSYTYTTTLRDSGFAVLAKHPMSYAKVHAKGVFALLFQPIRSPVALQLGGSNTNTRIDGETKSLVGRVNHVFTNSSVAVSCIIGVQLLLLTIIWFGFLQSAWRFKTIEWRGLVLFTGMLVLYFMLVAAGPETDGRFRIPFWPLVILVSSASLSQYILRKKDRNSTEVA